MVVMVEVAEVAAVAVGVWMSKVMLAGRWKEAQLLLLMTCLEPVLMAEVQSPSGQRPWCSWSLMGRMKRLTNIGWRSVEYRRCGIG